MRNQDEHNWGLVPRALLFFLILAATVLAQDTQVPQARADLEVAVRTAHLKVWANSSNNTKECVQQSSYSEDSNHPSKLFHAFSGRI